MSLPPADKSELKSNRNIGSRTKGKHGPGFTFRTWLPGSKTDQTLSSGGRGQADNGVSISVKVGVTVTVSVGVSVIVIVSAKSVSESKIAFVSVSMTVSGVHINIRGHVHVSIFWRQYFVPVSLAMPSIYVMWSR